MVKIDPAKLPKARGGAEAFGTVYVKHEGRWGTICDDGFAVADAKVILGPFA